MRKIESLLDVPATVRNVNAVTRQLHRIQDAERRLKKLGVKVAVSVAKNDPSKVVAVNAC